MSFCSNCGQPIADSAKFCSNCGAPAGDSKAGTYKTREQEYAGKMVKCPACGEDIPSFTAICPSCGHEINSAKLAPALKEFIDKINEYDKIIADTPQDELPKKGWKSWKTGTRVFWIIVNLLTCCVPLVVYLVWPLLKPFIRSNASPKLTPTEQKKTALIENFTFPNDRESVLEALLFIKSKIAFLASDKINERNIYWLRLWGTKATQLHQKAKILLTNDSIAEAAYGEITTNKEKINQKVHIRAGIGAAIIAGFCIFVAFNGVLLNGDKIIDYVPSRSEGSPTINADTVTDEANGIYTYEIRNYVGQNVASVGELDGDFLVDDYGSGSLRIVFISSDGMFIRPDNREMLKNYTVVAQNIDAGETLAIIHLRDSDGEPYSNLVDYQSYEEIILFVAPIGDTAYAPVYGTVAPTFDRHVYRIRDYVGRNAASFGTTTGDNRIDEYGVGELRLSFTSDDGTYVDAGDINELQKYIVTAQDIAPNTELKFEYETDGHGNEYNNLLRNQNYETINLTVRRLDEEIIEKMPLVVGFEQGTYQNIVVNNITFSLPNYWEEEGSKNEYLQYYAEKGEQVVMLSIAYPEESDDEYDVSFEGLYADNDNMVENVGAMFTDGNVFKNEVFESDYGAKGILYHFTYSQNMGWFEKEDGHGYLFCFPSAADRRWFYITLLCTNNVTSANYVDDFMTLLSSIKETV